MASPSANTLQHNVRHYGAKGDGTTDDTAAIQATIDAAQSTGHLYLPPGSYKVTSALTLNGTRAVRLSGASGANPDGLGQVSRIFGAINGPLISRTNTDDSNGGVVIEDLAIKNTHNTGICVSLTGTTPPAGIYRCWLDGWKGIVLTTNTYSTMVMACKFRMGGAPLSGSIAIQAESHTEIHNPDINGYERGIDIPGGFNGVGIWGGRIEQCTTGIHVGSNGSVEQGVIISAIYFELVGVGINLDHCASTLVTGCKQHSQGADTSFLTTNRTFNTTILSCSTSGTYTTPINVQTNASRDNLTFIGVRTDAAWTIADRRGLTVINSYPQGDIIRAPVIATGSLPAAAAAEDGRLVIEDAGAGNRNLILYGGGERFRIDGGAAI